MMNAKLLEEIERFGKTPKARDLTEKTFDKEGYELAITRATADLTARTLSPRENVAGKLINVLLKWDPSLKIKDYKGEESFIDRIEKYFADPARSREAFDKWHRETCSDILLPAIRHFYTNRDTERSDVCYGKAQKILNMTLKSCYCLDGARGKEEHFEHCHVALDSFTLAWYRHHKKENTSEWSNLGFDEYISIQESIRGFERDIDLFDGLTPLQKEFFVWRLEIMKMTVDEICKCFGGIIEEDYAEEYLRKHGMENQLKMAKMILHLDGYETLADEGFIEWLEKIPESRKIKPAAEFLLDEIGIEKAVK